MDAKTLATDIRAFLADHAKVCPDDASEYTSPDAYELGAAALLLETQGFIQHLPFSEWGSGGFAPYGDREAQKRHDSLVESCQRFLQR